jgi:histidine ammonia-lyase
VNIRVATLYADLSARMGELARAHPRVQSARHIVERALSDGKAYYGINTGFGALASKRIDPSALDQLQYNLLLSHAVGLGEPVPRAIARLMLQLKIHSLSLGHSGISSPVFERLLEFETRGLVPAVPCKGSLGASGDLAPLAHMSLPLIGKGRFWKRDGGGTREAEEVLREERLEPVTLGPKDALSLINGTQLMAAYGAFVLERAITLVKNADVLAALSLEALRGSSAPFDARIHALRPHPGQKAVAQNVRALMTESQILESHKDCGRVQDPYSLRCVPQVHGASRDALDHARNTFEIELNSVTDNPLVFEDGSIISGGNFHGQPLALALDFSAIALAELASISERRTYLLLTGHDGLPTLLMNDTGLNSGFMIPQYTAAALVSQNKVLCHPASVDSIPTCLGQEDHVSMGGIAALKLLEVLDNVEKVLAIEALSAAQALDYRRPLSPGLGVAAAHACVREVVAHKEADAYFGDDIERAVALLRSGELVQRVEAAVGALA